MISFCPIFVMRFSFILKIEMNDKILLELAQVFFLFSRVLVSGFLYKYFKNYDKRTMYKDSVSEIPCVFNTIFSQVI